MICFIILYAFVAVQSQHADDSSLLFDMIGDCEVWGSCVSSTHYPNSHEYQESCSVTILQDVAVTLGPVFDLDPVHDHLTIKGNDVKFSSEIPTHMRSGESFSWTTESTSPSNGWQLCFSEDYIDALYSTNGFNCVDISSTISTDHKFVGATTASNELVVFAPFASDCVGTFDPVTSNFHCIDISSTIIAHAKFMGATTAGNGLAVFAPSHADCVGTFDPATSNFDCFDISSEIIIDSEINVDFAFSGATTASNGLVVFAPENADCVGTFDPLTSTFNCIDISSTIDIDWKFWGAATASNGLVVFAPNNANCIGTFDPETSTFDCIDIPFSINNKFQGATTAENGLVVFAPYHVDCVGTFDPLTSTFDCIDISSTITDFAKFRGATTASNGLIIFSPDHATCAGIFDPVASIFNCIDTSLTAYQSLAGVTAANNGLVFAPLHGDCVGTLIEDTRSPTEQPTEDPTVDPTQDPTVHPTSPTGNPTRVPTGNPTQEPTVHPTRDPTGNPTRDPTGNPTRDPTGNPTQEPTGNPTQDPSRNPTRDPTGNPTRDPTQSPTGNPTQGPTGNPSQDPSRNPTREPTGNPTQEPSNKPTAEPTADPTHVVEEMEDEIVFYGDFSSKVPDRDVFLREFNDYISHAGITEVNAIDVNAGSIKVLVHGNPDQIARLKEFINNNGINLPSAGALAPVLTAVHFCERSHLSRETCLQSHCCEWTVHSKTGSGSCTSRIGNDMCFDEQLNPDVVTVHHESTDTSSKFFTAALIVVCVAVLAFCLWHPLADFIKRYGLHFSESTKTVETDIECNGERSYSLTRMETGSMRTPTETGSVKRIIELCRKAPTE